VRENRRKSGNVVAGSTPTGTVTFFFSDIEGSTRLLETLGPDYPEVLERHHRILRKAFSECAAVEMGTEGDSFFAVFPSATDAVAAAVAIQRAIAGEEWPRGARLQIRIGLHTGEAAIADAGYVGLDLHRAARIMAAAHGGQILLSDATRSVVERSLADGISLRGLGEHRLRDLSAAERLFQVVTEDLQTDFPPPRTLDAIPNNLPTQVSALVGREAELRAIRDYLASPTVRLLTLTGPGGIGKTRLSVQAAADEIERFRDGVYFVDLSAARDAGAALQAIVRALGITVSGDEELRVALGEQLRGRQLLLLLDNFEQVMPAADDVAHLLQRSSQLKVVVTSREALRIRGEQLVPIAPLSLPDGDLARPTATEVSRYEAVRLFVARAREARPSFSLTDDNAAVVLEICARLDGLPLAIELAAARLKLFSPEELTDRLRSRLDVLRGGARDLPVRQQTLRSTIEWSYDLLDEEERGVFELLSVFSPARVDAVEDVAARLDWLASVDVVDRLASLVDKSLIRGVEDAQGQQLMMLDTIREYAAGRLDAEPERSVAARGAHAQHFASVAAANRADLHGSDRDRTLAGLAAELGNLQAAWRYAVEAGDVVLLNKLLDALWTLHDVRGWYHGAVALTNDLLTALSTADASPDRAEEELTLRMSLARGLLALHGYTAEVEELYRETLAVAESAGGVPKRLPVLRSLASFYLYRGEIDKTAAIGREVLELGEREQDTSLQVEGHLLLGPSLAFVGDVSAGLGHLDRAIELFDPKRHRGARLRLGPNPGVAARAVSGLLHWLFGYPETAARRAASALELAEQLDHPYSLAYATFHVALLDTWGGRLDVVHRRTESVLKIAEEHDYRIWTALGLVLQGVATAGLGRPEDGLAQTQRGAALYENLRTPPVFWPQVLGLWAQACALAGRTSEALDLVDQAADLAVEGSWDSAALKVQKADLLVSQGEPGRAEEVLLRAYDEAGQAGARMTQLRAATRVARLAAKTGRRDATGLLRETFDAFTEGFETPDLLDAQALLGEAANGRQTPR
jgi:predicted ATPase/class 3 adenylate cyclase